MALFTSRRNILLTVCSIFLFVGAAVALTYGIKFLADSSVEVDIARRNSFRMLGIFLVVIGVVALVAILLILWVCCCYDRRAPFWLFVFGLVMTDVVLIAGIAVMLMFGITAVIKPEGKTLSGAVLISFSFLFLAAVIAIPILFSCRRKRESQELKAEAEAEERNLMAVRTVTEDAKPLVPSNDGKTLV
ncbi:uncharacterized protein TM35_000151390 [Trypanosoma theileri]|uniref:Transmembrane protein n=1 Tax=Trypanosoma theileri TaxID=67003 RepID=A0A1X0NVZ3_9TRYP|nr:uncharacterized protein TM35_000151390 [Trypanosoma theileri]ORC88708.1 hypothetical protein TM35_000151390 [Trypanosoma theileri]